MAESDFKFAPGSILRRLMSLGGTMKNPNGSLYHYGVASQYIDQNGEQMVYQFGGPYPGDAPYESPGMKILNRLWPPVNANGYTGTHIGLTPMTYFAEGRNIEVETVPKNPIPVLKRADSLIHHNGYNPAFRNCEHFAKYCLTGKWSSKQALGMSIKTAGCLGLFALAGVVAYRRKR